MSNKYIKNKNKIVIQENKTKNSQPKKPPGLQGCSCLPSNHPRAGAVAGSPIPSKSMCMFPNPPPLIFFLLPALFCSSSTAPTQEHPGHAATHRLPADGGNR